MTESLNDGEIQESSIVAARSDVMMSPLGDGCALLDMRSGVYYQLNAVGAEVWKSLTLSKTVAGIVAELCDQFDVGVEQLSADIVALVSDLAMNNLVTIDGFGNP